MTYLPSVPTLRHKDGVGLSRGGPYPGGRVQTRRNHNDEAWTLFKRLTGLSLLPEGGFPRPLPTERLVDRDVGVRSVHGYGCLLYCRPGYVSIRLEEGPRRLPGVKRHPVPSFRSSTPHGHPGGQNGKWGKFVSAHRTSPVSCRKDTHTHVYAWTHNTRVCIFH